MSIAPEGCDPVLRGAIELLVGFVTSTASGNGRSEQLESDAGLATWTADHGLSSGDDAPTAADAFTARELREALITVFRAHCDCATAPVEDAEAYLRRAARRYPVATTFTAEGVAFEAAQPGVPGIFGTLFAAAAEVTSHGHWARLKMCKNPSCYAGFYDKTRNLSGQFCSAACNSQVSMRAYRERQRSA